MTFERVIGQHMQDAGLYDILIECKIIGPGVAEQVFSGKKHKKAMQCHKLTFQALWRVILPQFQQHVMANNANIYKTFSTVLSMIWMTYYETLKLWSYWTNIFSKNQVIPTLNLCRHTWKWYGSSFYLHMHSVMACGSSICMPLVECSPFSSAFSYTDLATDGIQISLMNAETHGTNKMKQFVQDRLIGNKKFHDALQQSKLKTFHDLYNFTIKDKANKTLVLEADRTVLQ